MILGIGFVLWALVLVGMVHLVVDADLTKPWRDSLSGFPHRVAACRYCSAAWASPVSAFAVVLLMLLRWPWCMPYGLLFVAPPAGIGLAVLLGVISPTNAVVIAFKEVDKRRSSDG